MGISAVVAAVGMGTSVAGAVGQSHAAGQEASAERDIANAQMEQNQLYQKAMELNARRQQMQTIRQAQRARALSTATAVSQNAQGGSVLQGAYGQISGEEGNNLLGISQNLELGEQNFSLTNQISQYKMNIADARTNMATFSGLSSVGGSILGSLGPISRLSGGFTFGNPYSSNNTYNPGNSGGTGGNLGGYH